MHFLIRFIKIMLLCILSWWIFCVFKMKIPIIFLEIYTLGSGTANAMLFPPFKTLIDASLRMSFRPLVTASWVFSIVLKSCPLKLFLTFGYRRNLQWAFKNTWWLVNVIDIFLSKIPPHKQSGMSVAMVEDPTAGDLQSDCYDFFSQSFRNLHVQIRNYSSAWWRKHLRAVRLRLYLSHLWRPCAAVLVTIFSTTNAFLQHVYGNTERFIHLHVKLYHIALLYLLLHCWQWQYSRTEC